MEYLILFVMFGALICGLLGGIAGNAKNAVGSGFLLGFLFGPLGVIVALVVDNREKCPKCCGYLQGKASVCPHCGASITWQGSKPTITPRRRRTSGYDFGADDDPADQQAVIDNEVLRFLDDPPAHLR